MSSFIILDRDGVINYESNEYIKSPEEWQPIPGSLEAIALLNRSHFQVLVATNQSGIGRGYFDIPTLTLIHQKMTRELAKVGGHIQEIFFCPHHPDDGCFCRKPKPGMLFQMQANYPIKWRETFFIGDSIRDVRAANALHSKPILVLTGNGQESLENFPELKNIPTFVDLKHAVQYILRKKPR